MGSDSRTLWVGNLSENVDEDLLYELFTQAGPLESVNVKKAQSNGGQSPFAFVTFRHDVSVGYAIALFDGISLYGRALNMKQRHGVTPDYKYRDIMESYLHRGRSHWDAQSQGRGFSAADARDQQLQPQQMPAVNQRDPYMINQRYMMAQQQMILMAQQHFSDSGPRGSPGGFRREQRDTRGGHGHQRHEKGTSRRHHSSKHHHHSR